MVPAKETRWDTLLCAAIVTAVTAALFVYVIQLHKPWFGASPICLETWLNSGMLLWIKNWIRENPVQLWFGYFWEPASIEFPTLASREIYNSYPPGAGLPIYALSRLLAFQPSIATVMAFGLASQAVTVAALVSLAFLFARKAGGSPFDAGCLAIIPALACLCLPAPAFLFQMAYIHIVVLPVFALYILLEFIRDEYTTEHAPHWIGVLQGCLAWYGALCDWLFAFVLVCVYLKRFARGQLFQWSSPAGRPFPQRIRTMAAEISRSTLSLWGGAGLAWGLFALLLWHFHRFNNLASRFTERSAAGSHRFLAPTVKTLFWNFHIPRGYGQAGRWLILASVAFLLFLLGYAACRRLIRRPMNPVLASSLSLLFMFVAPCMLHVLVFRQDSSHFLHFFTTAKFSVVMAMAPFILVPVAAMALFGGGIDLASPARYWRTGTPPLLARCSLVAPLMLILAAAYTGYMARDSMKAFTMLPTHDTTREPAFLGAHTAYNEIVFTPTSILAIDAQPMGLAHSMKRVYVADSLAAVNKTLNGVEGEYVVDLFLHAKTEPSLPPELRLLAKNAFDRQTDGNVMLYKVHKTDVLRLCAEAGVKDSALTPDGAKR